LYFSYINNAPTTGAERSRQELPLKQAVRKELHEPDALLTGNDRYPAISQLCGWPMPNQPATRNPMYVENSAEFTRIVGNSNG